MTMRPDTNTRTTTRTGAVRRKINPGNSSGSYCKGYANGKGSCGRARDVRGCSRGSLTHAAAYVRCPLLHHTLGDVFQANREAAIRGGHEVLHHHAAKLDIRHLDAVKQLGDSTTCSGALILIANARDAHLAGRKHEGGRGGVAHPQDKSRKTAWVVLRVADAGRHRCERDSGVQIHGHDAVPATAMDSSVQDGHEVGATRAHLLQVQAHAMAPFQELAGPPFGNGDGAHEGRRRS